MMINKCILFLTVTLTCYSVFGQGKLRIGAIELGDEISISSWSNVGETNVYVKSEVDDLLNDKADTNTSTMISHDGTNYPGTQIFYGSGVSRTNDGFLFEGGGSTYNLYLDPKTLVGATTFSNNEPLYIPSSEKVSIT
jgi:hypothetical protein